MSTNLIYVLAMFVLMPIWLLRYVSITYVLFDEREFRFFLYLLFFFQKVDRFVVHIVEAFIGISTNIAKTKMRFVTRIASLVSNGKEIAKKRDFCSMYDPVEKCSSTPPPNT